MHEGGGIMKRACFLLFAAALAAGALALGARAAEAAKKTD
jgi:hypothetical protein